ncbi:MAG: YHS domain-containing (seleno)protein [Gammaproteobacteria bacterium]
MSTMLKQFCLVTVLSLAAAGAAAENVVTAGEANPALGGYSPVSYFEHGEPRLGSPEYQATHDGSVYYFTSAEQLERFLENPAAYAPAFPHHCPYNLALGRAAAIDPTNFRIVGGQLLIFHRSEEMDGLQKWNGHDADEQEKLLERARGNFKLLRF